MSNYRSGSEGLASALKHNKAINMNKPQPKGSKSGVQPELIRALVNTEIVTTKQAAQRAQDMANEQAQLDGGTVADMFAQQAQGGGGRQNPAQIAQQLAGVQQNKAANAKKAQAKLAKMAMGKKKPLMTGLASAASPRQPQGISQGMPRGMRTR